MPRAVVPPHVATLQHFVPHFVRLHRDVESLHDGYELLCAPPQLLPHARLTTWPSSLRYQLPSTADSDAMLSLLPAIDLLQPAIHRVPPVWPLHTSQGLQPVVLRAMTLAFVDNRGLPTPAHERRGSNR